MCQDEHTWESGQLLLETVASTSDEFVTLLGRLNDNKLA